jgi:hypothetical protein
LPTSPVRRSRYFAMVIHITMQVTMTITPNRMNWMLP